MSGMGIEFMTGAMLLSAINAATILVIVWMVYRIVKKIFKYVNDDSLQKEKINAKIELFVCGMALVFNIFFASAAVPKLTIETTPNRDLMEYQRNTEEVVIETPPPRTQILDGFRPLNEN